MNSRIQQLATRLSPSPRMPVLFVGHGNPMNAIMDNVFTRGWSDVGKKLTNPQAIVVMSAHWLTRGIHVTDAPRQPLIYDMYGFPDELYLVRYDAQGSPDIAARLAKQLAEYEARLDSSWGLDHGTWSVLVHLAPEPKVPVLQISFDLAQPLDELAAMYRQLRPLRDKGVVFIGSGNIVHNLRQINWVDDRLFDWAVEFDELAATAMSSKDMSKIVEPLRISKAAPLAVPTDDHYRPMVAAMALLDSDEQPEFFNDRLEMGSLSMRSFISKA